MSNAVFPAKIKGLTWTVTKAFDFATIAQKSANQYEQRISQTQNPIWHWTLVYDYLYDGFVTPNDLMPYAPYTDFRTLLGFMLARQGTFDSFLYSDPTDNSVGPAVLNGSPNPAAQLQLVNDGAGNYYSPLQRNMGGQFLEDITDLNGSIALYGNGALLSSGYTIQGPGLALPSYSFAGLYAKWNVVPAAPVTAQFNFYFRVKAELDTQDFEEFMQGLWTIGGSGSKNGSGQLKLMTSRPPTA